MQRAQTAYDDAVAADAGQSMLEDLELKLAIAMVERFELAQTFENRTLADIPRKYFDLARNFRNASSASAPDL